MNSINENENLENVTTLNIVGSQTTSSHLILTEPALRFLEKLVFKFDNRIKELLLKRDQNQKKIDEGIFPNFLEETEEIRSKEWNVSSLPEDLHDRRVEITGPVDRKMIINALNSGANVFMADFEDSNSPTWENVIEGQANLIDAVNRSITFTNEQGKHYKLNKKIAVLMVRPRGLHLPEKHILYKNEPVSGSLVDFGLYFFHNSHELLKQGTGPYFYLPKLQNYLEARLWNDIFVFSQNELNIPQGTIKATVLIEHVLVAFQMDEILYELREHSAGLNCGRWDYIFSFIKTFRNYSDFILPDRAEVTMDKHFLKSYVDLLVATTHRRSVHGMGGMAAQIPLKDPDENKRALEKVRKDKEREVKAGHDGTWVAHPGLVEVAKVVFNNGMTSQNQINSVKKRIKITQEDLLKVPKGSITEEGFRANINIGIRYMANWLNGNGCVPIFNLMEDAATAEISRSQLWQWIHHGASFNDGKKITPEMYSSIKKEELLKIESEIGKEFNLNGNYQKASELFDEIILKNTFTEFLTLIAYENL